MPEGRSENRYAVESLIRCRERERL